MVASKREEMDREIDHVLITQSENLRRYWEVSSPFLTWSCLSLLEQMCACFVQRWRFNTFTAWQCMTAECTHTASVHLGLVCCRIEVESATKHAPEGCSEAGYI